MKGFTSIHDKLIMVVVLTMAIALGGMSVVNYFTAKSYLVKSVEQGLTARATFSSQEIASWLNERKAEISTLANSPLLEGRNEGVLNAYLEDESKRLKKYERLFFIDAKGNIRAGTEQGNVKDKDFFRAVMASGEIVVSDPAVYRPNGVPETVVAAPVKVGGKIVGVVAGAVKLDELDRTTNLISTSAGKGAYAYLVQGDGLVINHANKDKVLKVNPLKDPQTGQGTQEATEKAVKRQRGAVRVNDEGVQTYLAYAPVLGTSWSAMISVPVEEVSGYYSSLFIPFVATPFVVILLICVSINVFLKRVMVRPIDKLKKLMAKVEAGDLSARGEVTADDELGRLTQSINRTIEALQGSYDDSRRKVSYLNSIPTPVMAIDRDMNVVYINPAGASMANKRAELCIGRKCYDLFHKGDCNTAQCQTRWAMEHEGTFTADTSAKLPTGVVPLRYTATALKDKEGNVIGGLEYIIDISEEQEAVMAVQDLLADAIEGKLDSRKNPDNYKVAGFKKVVGGINSILEAMTAPIKEASKVLKEVGQGNLMVSMNGEYKGDYAEIKNSVNYTIDKIKNIITDIYDTTFALKTSSDKLSHIADAMAANSQEMCAMAEVVNTNTIDITGGMSETANATKEASDNIDGIAAAIEEMNSNISNLASSAEQASVNVGQVGYIVGHISDSIQAVSNSAKDVAVSVSSVAGAVKEINTSLSEVNKNCDRSTHITQDAGLRAKETTEIIRNLNGLSKQIGKIVGVINDIADETNLLALNAAIEAANAGDAGRGFAVVANEVKELARQTAEATDEISQQIEAMQDNMGDAVKAVERITQVIDEITCITSTIATSVTEQTAGVGEITRSVDVASEKVNLITTEFGEIACNTQDAAKSAKEVSKGTEEIARLTVNLSGTSYDVARSTGCISTKVNEMANTAHDISKGTKTILHSVQEINGASEQMTREAVGTSNAARELAETSNKLAELVKQFRIQG